MHYFALIIRAHVLFCLDYKVNIQNTNVANSLYKKFKLEIIREEGMILLKSMRS